MPKLNRNGVNIYYEVHGSGPVILLTHGYSATAQMWKGQIEPLTKKHTLVTWDMRGHGQSDYPADQSAYSEEATVGDMAAILDALGAKKAIIGGLSLGGYMSLAFYRAHPERTRALLIIDTGPGFKKDEPREAWNARALATATGSIRPDSPLSSTLPAAPLWNASITWNSGCRDSERTGLSTSTSRSNGRS